MKKFYICVSILIIILVTLSSPIYSQNATQPPTSEAAAWNEAVAANSLRVYATFLRSYPDSNMKQQVRTAAEHLIRQAVEKEVKENNALVSKKGVEGTGVVPIGNWIGPGVIFTIEAGEIPLGQDFIILCDPTNPFVFTGVRQKDRTVLKGSPYDYTEVVSGSGVIIQHVSNKTYVYVFGVDVSSVVTKWEDWK